MRPFRSFFLISLFFFLFLFFARFLVLAFFAAAVLTFVAFVIRKIKIFSNYDYRQNDDDYFWQHPGHTAAVPSYTQSEEPLFFERQKETELNWLQDYRTIKVQ